MTRYPSPFINRIQKINLPNDVSKNIYVGNHTFAGQGTFKISLEDLRYIAQSLADVSVIEQAPMMEGRTMLVVLGPAKLKPAKEAKPE